MGQLQFLKEKFEKKLSLFVEGLQEGGLKQAVVYSLTRSQGKRVRPLIVLMVGEALGNQFDVTASALSVEIFHTASLVADDLPCMDDDDWRREVATLHKAFSEDVAILVSYHLIALGYGAIAENGRVMRLSQEEGERADRVVVLSLEAVTESAQKATEGQFLDLYPPDQKEETLRGIIGQKTGSLFEIAFLLGWLFGGGDEKKAEELKRCGRHLGLVFQLADDMDDLEEDRAEGRLNFLHFYPKEKITLLYHNEIRELKNSLQSLGLWTPLFQEFLDSFTSKVPVLCLS